MALADTTEQNQTEQGTLDRRIWLALMGLYVAQAIPLYLVAAALPPFLRSQGVNLAAIGSFAILMLPWVFKALWAPWIDRLSALPRVGRKGVVLGTQLAVFGSIVALSFLDPLADLSLFFPLLMVMSFAAATQDIATDGYAVEHLPPQKQSGGNAIQSGAVALGVLLGGSGTLILFDLTGWQFALLSAGGLSMLSVVAFLMVPETLGRRHQRQTQDRPRLRRFFAREGALMIFAFALIFRLPEGLIQALEQSFLVDMGFSLSQIGLISGGSAACVGLFGAVFGMMVINRSGLAAFFVTIVVLRTVIFGLYGYAAAYGLPLEMLVALSFLKTFSRYMEMVGLYTAFMRVASLAQAGTDFTILSSANLFVYMVGSMLAGVLAQSWGFAPVFTLAAILSAFTGFVSLRLFRRSLANEEQ